MHRRPRPGRQCYVIRPITALDVPEVVNVHTATLPGSLPAYFGPRFHRLYYTALLEDPRFFCDAFVWEGRVAGVLSYTSDSRSLFADALRRRFAAFAFAAGLGLLANPARFRAVIRLLPLMRGTEAGAGSEVPAELLSFGVLPEYRQSSEFFRSTGRHVARELMERSFVTLAGAGASSVKAFVEPEERNAAVNRYYQRLGFRLVCRTKRLGYEANDYLRNLVE